MMLNPNKLPPDKEMDGDERDIELEIAEAKIELAVLKYENAEVQ